MTYAKAAAVVKACAFPITSDLRADQIPYVAEGTVTRIRDIIARGSTDDLDAHRYPSVLAFSAVAKACLGPRDGVS